MAGIFINYRRDDAPGVAGRLFDHLAPKFSRRGIFMDVDAMKPGRDFVTQLDTQVSQCHVLLAVIGPHWLDAKDHDGQRRLDNSNDYVRIELASALKRDIPVIPVLVDGAVMPPEESLPDDLKPLVRRQALELRHTRFNSDAEAIMQALVELEPPRKLPWPLIGAGLIVAAGAAAAVVLWPRLTSAPQPVGPPPTVVEKARSPNPVVPTTRAPSPPAASASNPSPSEGLPVKLGDPIDTVKATYSIKGNPEGAGAPTLRVALSGLTFFFTEQDKTLRMVRADPPFSGNIEHVRIGDTADEVVAKLGQPYLARELGFHNKKRYWFRVDLNTLMCDFDEAGRIESIFFSKNGS